MYQYGNKENQPQVRVELIEFQIRFILHQAVGEFKPGQAPAGEKYQYAQDNIGDAED